ncbi:MAG: hypothetical protein ACXADY_25955 [Candidatus Hodarchaeales archaeon]|jgi:hypothetical protein
MGLTKKKILNACLFFIILLSLFNTSNFTISSRYSSTNPKITHFVFIYSRTYTIQQADTQPPQFSPITFSSTTVYPDDSVTASIIVTDTAGENETVSGINTVRCQYSVDYSLWSYIGTSISGGNTYSATIPASPASSVISVRFEAIDLDGNTALSTPSSYTVSVETNEYNLEFYLNKLMEMSFNALRFIVMIIVLALSVAFTVWWVLYVFKIFPTMLADLTQRIHESYGNIGVFIFVVLFFPSLLVFIIHFLSQNISLLVVALQGLLGDLIGDESVFGTILSNLKGGFLRLR